ncbi:hypothetical protein SFC08_01850 [Lysinibacillus halotolerans]
MNYLVVVAIANGEKVFNRKVLGVKEVTLDNGVYIFRDYVGDLLFSAPFDSVVYVEQEQ